MSGTPGTAGPRSRVRKELAIRVEPKAGLPQNTVHFTVEAYGTRATKAAQLLEGTYLDFIDATGLANLTQSRKIRVVIFENRKEFRSKTKGRHNAMVLDNAVVTFEQEKIDRVLMAQTAGLLFDEYLGRKPAHDERWLRQGIVETVIARRGGADIEEARDQWRTLLRRDQPASLAALIGKEKIDADEDDRPEPAAGERKRRPGAGNQRRYQVTAASLVAFLGTWGGRLNLAFLLAELRDQKSLDQALAKAYPGKFRNFEELYGFWLADEIGGIQPRLPGDGQSRISATGAKKPGRNRR